MCFFLNHCCFILCVWVFGLHVCVCTTCAPGSFGGHKGTLGPLKLELQMVVSCHAGAGTKTPWKSNILHNGPALVFNGTPYFSRGKAKSAVNLNLVLETQALKTKMEMKIGGQETSIPQ